MTKSEKIHWMGKVPDHCQICPLEIINLFIDGKTVHGPWAILCPQCHQEIGVGLGLGRGKLYQLQSDDKWLKTAG